MADRGIACVRADINVIDAGVYTYEIIYFGLAWISGMIYALGMVSGGYGITWSNVSKRADDTRAKSAKFSPDRRQAVELLRFDWSTVTPL